LNPLASDRGSTYYLLFIICECPRYLTKDIYELMQKNPQTINIRVEKVNLNPTPIQLRLLCHLTAEWPSDFQPFSGEEYQPLSF
jgi:hypothetical protein